MRSVLVYAEIGLNNEGRKNKASRPFEAQGVQEFRGIGNVDLRNLVGGTKMLKGSLA